MQFINCIIIIGVPATPAIKRLLHPTRIAKKGRSSQAIYVSPIRENANGGGGKWNGIPFFATFGNRCLLEVAGHVFFIM